MIDDAEVSLGADMYSRSLLTYCAGGCFKGSDYKNKRATLNKLVPLLREQALSVRYARCCAQLCLSALTYF